MKLPATSHRAHEDLVVVLRYRACAADVEDNGPCGAGMGGVGGGRPVEARFTYFNRDENGIDDAGKYRTGTGTGLENQRLQHVPD